MKKFILISIVAVVCFGCELLKKSESTNPKTGATNIVYVPNPSVDAAIDSARSINAVANPTPFAPLVELALAAISGGLVLYARRKNKQSVELESQFQTIVKGVEIGANQATKEAIQSVSEMNGNSHEINKKVQEITAKKDSKK